MLNLKKNLYIAGAFALCTLAACSSDNPSSAGSPTMPNATANKIECKTAATSTITVDGGELKTFEAENGASVGCSANGITYSSEIQINSNKLVVTHLKLENAGKLGAPVPDWLKRYLNDYKDKIDHKQGGDEEEKPPDEHGKHEAT